MQKFKREKWSNSVTQTSAICWLKTPVCITEGRTLLQTRSSNPSSGRTPWVRLQPSLLHNCSSPPTNFHREDAKPRTGNPDPAPPRGGKRERRLVHNSPQRPPVHIKVSQSWARGQLHAPAPHTCARAVHVQDNPSGLGRKWENRMWRHHNKTSLGWIMKSSNERPRAQIRVFPNSGRSKVIQSAAQNSSSDIKEILYSRFYHPFMKICLSTNEPISSDILNSCYLCILSHHFLYLRFSGDDWSFTLR